MRPRVFLDAEVGSILRRVLKPNDRLECQRRCQRLCREVDQRQAIAENVVNPPNLGWTGRDLESAIQQVLVKTVPRPEHQLMRAWPHRLLVLVCRRVMNGENRHGGPLIPKHSQTFTSPLRALRTRWRSTFSSFLAPPPSDPAGRRGPGPLPSISAHPEPVPRNILCTARFISPLNARRIA